MHITRKILPCLIAVMLVVGADTADAAKKKAKRKRRATPPVTKVEPASEPVAAPTVVQVSTALAAAASPAPTTPATAPSVEVITASADVSSSVEAPLVPGTPMSDIETRTTSHVATKPWLVGAHLGAAVPGVISKLGFGGSGGLDVGYLLPWMEQRMQVYGRLDYLRPSYWAEAEDPRLTTSTTYSYKVIEEELVLGLGAVARLWHPDAYVNVFGRLGGELRMQRSTARGRATTSLFGENSETKSAAGLLLGGGGELRFGPGSAFAELDLSYADLHHAITGDSATGGLGFLAGYAMRF